MTHSRWLLSLALSGACASAASAQELLIPSNPQALTPPPIEGVVEPVSTSAPILQTAQPPDATSPAAPPATTATTIGPVPEGAILPYDEMPATVRISDCPQSYYGYGAGSVATGRRRCAPPTTGWNPPAVNAMNRMWVPYHKFFPNVWMGQPPGPQVRLPMIYMPTDTTQLGYYYQHVPHWHTYANMIPPVPRPVDWHVYLTSDATAYPTYSVVPSTETQEVQPTPADGAAPNQAPAPPPPQQSDLDKSAAAPELLPLMR